jgi:hypothetical protein
VENIIKQYKKLTDSQKIRDQIGVNQEFQQTFLWGYSPLFVHEDNKIKLNSGILSFEYFYPLDTSKGIDFFSIINSNGSKDGSLKKQKNFPGYLLYEVSEFIPSTFENDHLNRMIVTAKKRKSTNLNNYKLEEAQQIIDKMNTKNLQEFKESIQKKDFTEIDPKYYLKLMYDEFLYTTPKSPFFTFVHELFIYPKNVNFTNLKVLDGTKPKNIFLEIKLISNQKEMETLPRFVDLQNHEKFKTEYNCLVTLNNPFPFFIDTVKLILPIPIHQYHYLLFNFYHVHEEKKKKEVKKTFIACSVLPLSHVTEPQEKEHQLAVCKSIPTDFFKYDEEPVYNFQKHSFFLTTKLVSTIYPQESSVSQFFRECSPFLNVVDPNKKQNTGFVATTITAANKALQELKTVDIRKLISHYPLLLDLMFSIMCRSPDIMNNFINSKDLEQSQQGGNNRKRLSGAVNSNRRQSMKIEFDPNSLTFPSVSETKDDKKRNSGTADLKSDESGLSKLKKRFSFAVPQLKQRSKSIIDEAGGNDVKSFLKNQKIEDRKPSLGKKFTELFKKDEKEVEKPVVEQRKSYGTGVNGGNQLDQFTDFFAMNQSIHDLQKNTFEALVSLLRGACDHFGATGRTNSLLSSYVSHVFNDVINTKSPVCFVLTERWTDLLSKSVVKSSNSESLDGPKKFNRRMSLSALVHNQMSDEMDLFMHTLNFSWFFFDIIHKSFLLLKTEDGGYGFIGLLKELLKTVADKVVGLKDDIFNKVMSNYVNQQVCIFLNALSDNLKPIQLFDLIDSYYGTIHKQHLREIASLKENYADINAIRESIANSISLKQEFSLYFVENSQFLSLNNPLYFSDSKSISCPPMKLIISSMNESIDFYFHIKDVSESIDGNLLNMTKNLIVQSIEPIHHLFHKYDIASKLQDDSTQALISRISFPYVVLLISRIHDLLTIFEQRDQTECLKKYLKCFVFVLKNLENSFFGEWVKTMKPIEILNLMKIFQLILTLFTYSDDERKQIFMNSQITNFETIYAYKTFIEVVETKLVILYEIWNEKIFEDQDSEQTSILEVFDSKESTLLDHLLVIVSLLIKREIDCSVEPSEPFHKMLQLLAERDWESICHLKWMYSSFLQGLSFSDKIKENIYSELLTTFEDQISFPPPSDDIVFETKETDIEKDPNSGEIKAGTVDVLVEKLTNDKDPKFIQQFFLTYRSFMTPYELMDQISQRYTKILQLQTNDPDNVQYKLSTLRIINHFKLWLNDFFYDFDNALVVMLVNFLRKSDQYTPCNQIKSKLEKKLLGTEKDPSQTTFSKAADPSIIPKDLKNSTTFNFVQWDPLEIARQITLIEYSVFKKITPKECFNLSWTKKTKEQTSPNIVELTKRFNDLSYWFATLIVKEEDLKLRTKLLSHVIKVITACQSLNNFNAVTTINGALNNAAIHRLKKTFEGLTTNEKKKLVEINELVSNIGSYKAMRDALANSAPPTIPYLGVFLTDLTFIEEGASDVTKSGLVNFGKRRLFADVLLRIQLLQQQPYHFTPIPLLQNAFIQFDDLWNDSALFKQSRKIEPKQ